MEPLWSAAMSGCTIGSDPEVFVLDQDKQVIPAFRFLPCKKDSKMAFWDGFQAEFTTNPNAHGNQKCLSFLVDEVQLGLKEVLKKARAINPEARLTYKSVMDIPEAVMRSSNPEHIELGCMPSKNVYDLPPIQVEDPFMLKFRFAGCHFHFGYTIPRDKVPQVVKALDAVVGIISVPLFWGLEDTRRRQFYGRAGEYRTPSHGLEWRVLSSAVLLHPILFHLCYDVARAVFMVALHYPHTEWWVGCSDKDVVEIINNYDRKWARKIIASNRTALDTIFHRKFGSGTELTSWLHDLLHYGAKRYLPLDMEVNWRLKPGANWISHSDGDNCSVRYTATENFPRKPLQKKRKEVL